MHGNSWKVRIAAADIPFLNHTSQVLQLVELQPEHEEPEPATGLENPPLLLEKQAKADNILSALSWQLGQIAPSSDLLIGRSSSNFKPHPEQTYSYIGIFPLLIVYFHLDSASSFPYHFATDNGHLHQDVFYLLRWQPGGVIA